MRKLLAILLLFVPPTLAIAQEKKPLADAGIAMCDYPASGGGMGRWVTSKTGNAAAVELRTRVTGTGDQRRCVTSWILHVRRQSGLLREIVVAEREDTPADNQWAQENSFEINAWSKDGNMVLASQSEAQGDWDQTDPIIFDFQSSKHWRVDLYPLFKKLIPSDCYVVYRPLHFDDEGKVLISALSTDDDREPGTPPCFADSVWRLDFQHNAISRVP